MTVLAGGDVVLPDRVFAGAVLTIENGRIAAIEEAPREQPSGVCVVDARGCYVVPGFIDVHVHGVGGADTLDSGDPIAQMAAALPRYGVTSFCPTTVACGPDDLRRVLTAVSKAAEASPQRRSRVLPAHLESNFINPEYRGAQPQTCLRLPPVTAGRSNHSLRNKGDFTADEILATIAEFRASVGIVTLAPELPGGLDLVRTLVSAGHCVSLGHSAATFEDGCAAIEAGARHATHLFNRMPPMTHRAPGLAGAVLARDEVTVELICDGYHVHPSLCRLTIAAKGAGRTIAITDGTAGSGLSAGSDARLGGRRIRVTESAATLDDGTLAGSTLTMDRAFRNIVNTFGFSVSDAATMCATTPARQLGLVGFGVLTRDAVADCVVLDREFRVVRTYVGGEEAYRG